MAKIMINGVCVNHEKHQEEKAEHNLHEYPAQHEEDMTARWEDKQCSAVPMPFDNNLWRKVDSYIRVHGRHFTNALAERAISKMVNVDGTGHRWSVADVKQAMETEGLRVRAPYTYADAAYAANMAYADFYPSVVPEEEMCLRYAYNLCNDPDGYDGQIFNRWTADIYATGEKIDWNDYI